MEYSLTAEEFRKLRYARELHRYFRQSRSSRHNHRGLLRTLQRIIDRLECAKRSVSPENRTPPDIHVKLHDSRRRHT